MRSWIEKLEEENMNLRRAQDLLLARINKLDTDTQSKIAYADIDEEVASFILEFCKDVQKIVEKPLYC